MSFALATWQELLHRVKTSHGAEQAGAVLGLAMIQGSPPVRTQGMGHSVEDAVKWRSLVTTTDLPIAQLGKVFAGKLQLFLLG